MNASMHRAPLTGLVGLFAAMILGLAGCPSKEGEQKDANAGGATTTTNTPPPGGGPLAALESSPSVNETWDVQGEKVQMLFYPRENVRVSAPCRTAGGQLQCAALQQIRRGMPVEIPRRELDGRASAGVKACIRLDLKIVSAVNPVGDEDSLCRFGDGSLLSTGALEQYGIRVLQ